ncbi:Calcium homeostasis endoplasmic reticulum protein [Trichinella murrelli]|uniref:Calcium homeostasis endoplasmic reticulum protein n=1 Tax=Trichinella murrelli TaxID=144512 RepID=A0A0V0TI74_9BILA|nr:Calcium homeostasis endoplasmic reticulum protein [Trichinella murrelli]
MDMLAHPPTPPDDSDVRNVIEKLAQFVARNGPEFEEMTKQKQKDNSRFAFLFGGPYLHYYRYRVEEEKLCESNYCVMLCKILYYNDSLLTQKVEANSYMSDSANREIQELKEKIAESEANLKAQHKMMMEQKLASYNLYLLKPLLLTFFIECTEYEKTSKSQQFIESSENEIMRNLMDECRLRLDEITDIVAILKDSSSKESVSSCQKWICQQCTTEKHNEACMRFLLSSIKDPEQTNSFRLLILYLVNDLAFNWRCRKRETMLEVMGRFVAPMFLTAYTLSSDDTEIAGKLLKLRTIWEKQKYFNDKAVEQMKNIQNGLQEYRKELALLYDSKIEEIMNSLDMQYKQYEHQHEEFVAHTRSKIAAIEMSQRTTPRMPFEAERTDGCNINYGMMAPTGPMANPMPQGMCGFVQTDGSRMQPMMPAPYRMNCAGFDQCFPGPAPPFRCRPDRMPPAGPWMMPPHRGTTWNGQVGMPNYFGPAVPRNPWQFPPPPDPSIAPPIPAGSVQHGIPRPALMEDSNIIPPPCPYYKLPAGLMLPLIHMSDNTYKPLDTQSIRRIPFVLPSDRLLGAIEAFYSPPSHDHPRDIDGWEKLGLYEFYMNKSAAESGNRPKESEEEDQYSSDSSSEC